MISYCQTDRSFALVYPEIIKFLADNMEVSVGGVIRKYCIPRLFITGNETLTCKERSIEISTLKC